jgi:hypothetical protein
MFDADAPAELDDAGDCPAPSPRSIALSTGFSRGLPATASVAPSFDSPLHCRKFTFVELLVLAAAIDEFGYGIVTGGNAPGDCAAAATFDDAELPAEPPAEF